MSVDAFGPNLRRQRLHHGVSIEAIAASTRIPAHLLKGLEQNDFTHWPAGVFARAYVRQYAEAIGADPDATVDEFCRSFPIGDRRVARTIREQAEIVGHPSEWKDEIPENVGQERRGAADEAAPARPAQSPASSLFLRLRRALGRA